MKFTLDPAITLSDSVDIDKGSLLYRINAVPIPAAVWLFGSGLIGLISVTRRKKV